MKKLIILVIIAALGFYAYKNVDKIKEYLGMSQTQTESADCGPCEPGDCAVEVIVIEPTELINPSSTTKLRKAVSQFYQFVVQEKGIVKAFLKDGNLVACGNKEQLKAVKQTIEAVKMAYIVQLELVAEKPGPVSISYGSEKFIELKKLNSNYPAYINALKKAGFLKGEEIKDGKIIMTVWQGGPRTNALSYPILTALSK